MKQRLALHVCAGVDCREPVLQPVCLGWNRNVLSRLHITNNGTQYIAP